MRLQAGVGDGGLGEATAERKMHSMAASRTKHAQSSREDAGEWGRGGGAGHHVVEEGASLDVHHHQPRRAPPHLRGVRDGACPVSTG